MPLELRKMRSLSMLSLTSAGSDCAVYILLGVESGPRDPGGGVVDELAQESLVAGCQSLGSLRGVEVLLDGDSDETLSAAGAEIKDINADVVVGLAGRDDVELALTPEEAACFLHVLSVVQECLEEWAVGWNARHVELVEQDIERHAGVGEGGLGYRLGIPQCVRKGLLCAAWKPEAQRQQIQEDAQAAQDVGFLAVAVGNADDKVFTFLVARIAV